MPFVETHLGHHWFMTREGQGRPLVFIHGWSADSRIWLQQRQYFSEKFTVLAIDLPGHGQTPWQDLPLKEIAGDFLEILSAEKPSVNIVGSSFGGLVALKMCELGPERIASLVLVGSQPKFFQTVDYPWGLSLERIANLKHQLMKDYPAIVPIFFRSLFTPEERAGERFKWLQGFRKNEDVPPQAALIRLLDILMAADLRSALRQVDVPVQFINGTEDYICPKEVYAHLQRELPRARFDWLEGCGHFPFVSRPTEFNKMLENFLESVHG